MCRSLHKTSIILDTMRTGSDWPVMSRTRKCEVVLHIDGNVRSRRTRRSPHAALPSNLLAREPKLEYLTHNDKSKRFGSAATPRYLSNRDASGTTTTVQPIEGTSDITGPERRQQRAFRGTSLIGPRLYLPATILIIVIAFIGFWPTYFGPALKGRVHVPPLIHLHAVIYVTWLALFATQVTLAATNRVKLHMQLGRWIMAYGVVVVIAGLMATAQGFGTRLATEDVFRAQRWLFGVLKDLVFFVPFLVAGWIYRRKPEIHKRLMIVATTILVLPAVSRMSFLGTPVPIWKFMLVWPIPVYLLMIHDFYRKRLIHPVYLIGVAAMLTMRLILPFGSSHAWQSIAAVITAFYRATFG